MKVVFASTGATYTIDARSDDRVTDDIMPRLQRQTGVDCRMQLILISHHSNDTVKVERCPRKGRVTLRDHGVELPTVSDRFFLFDLSVMQAKAAVSPPVESLPRFVEEKTGKVFILLQRSVTDYIEKQNNRLYACEVALRFLSQDVEIFRERMAYFEGKWRLLLEQQPATLLETAVEVFQRIKEAKVRPELSQVARALWDLYAVPEGESSRFIKSTKQEFASLHKKMPSFLESCQEAIRAAQELVAVKFPQLQDFQKARSELISIAEHQQLNLDKPADYVLLQRARQQVDLVEKWGNNLALWCRMKLKDVNQRSWTVWSEQSSIGDNGVRGLALRKVIADVRTLKVLLELPKLQHAVVDEALQRHVFRERVGLTVKEFAEQMEPIFLVETNRRASWLSQQSPYVRDWLSDKLSWLKEEPLHFTPVVPAFDKALPPGIVEAPQPTNRTFPIFQQQSTLEPPLQQHQQQQQQEDGRVGAASAPNNSDHVLQLETRIEYLEGELSRRFGQLESAQTEFRKREFDLTESNLMAMRQSVPFASGISQMAATLTSQKQRLSSAFVVQDFAAGDRVCFARRPAAVGNDDNDGRTFFYEVFLCAEPIPVYMSWSSQRHLQNLSELVIARLIDEPRRFRSQGPNNVYGLAAGTEYLELVVVDDAYYTYQGKKEEEGFNSNIENNNNE